MKNKAIISIMIVLLFVSFLTACHSLKESDSDYFGFSKKDFTTVDELNTRVGFLGDGSYYLILDCNENKEKALDIISDWNKLPLSENLTLIMYGGEKNGMNYSYDLAEEAKIPEVKNGYYCFYDRHQSSVSPTDDSELFSRSSYNFSLGVYDTDTDIFYYFEFDT